jgi:hypothetical protein
MAQITGLYQQYLGRPPSQAEYQGWISGQYGATDLAGITQQIASSGEAQARGGTTGGGTDLRSRIAKALSDAGSTDDPEYWYQKISADPNGAGSAWNYWLDRINRGDGAAGVRNGTVQRFQDSGGGATGGGVNYALAGASGGALPGTLTAYGVPTTPYQSQPWTGGAYTPPPVPGNLQTPYTPATWQGGDFQAPAKDPSLQTPYALRQWTGGQFTPPAISDALRTGNTFNPTATLPHFATGVTDFSGGAAVVGENGPETVTLPPGSNVTPWSSYYQPNLPTNLQTPFAAPTQADLQNSPGFQSRLALDQQARERSAAARGSILSGGTQLELGRAAQDYASNEYNNLFSQSLAGRGQNVNEYQQAVGNALGTRQQNVAEQGQQFNQALAGQQQNFGQYATQAGLDLGARQQNFNEGQGSFANALAAYQTNYNTFQGGVNNALAGRQQAENEYQANVLNPSQYSYQNTYAQYLADQQRQLTDYLTNYGINRTGVQDFFNQNNAVANRGLLATTSGRPAGT